MCKVKNALAQLVRERFNAAQLKFVLGMYIKNVEYMLDLMILLMYTTSHHIL